MSIKRAYAVAGILLFIAGSACAQDPKKDKNADKQKGKSAATGLLEDRGKFRLMVGGQQVGTEDFQISRSGNDWTATGKVEINVPGAPPSQVTSRLRLNASGNPLEYECTAQTSRKDSVNVTFSGGTASMVLQTNGSQGFPQDFSFDSPSVIILDNNLYHHYAILARLYDWQVKGEQTFATLVPQGQTPGSIRVVTGGPQNVEGVQYEHLRVSSADLIIELYVDSAHRLMRLGVPASNVEIIREKQ
ncbi:MAG: hypothetical protein HY046_01045 [Acidobacteria bacterium]|nr:hypothetical protein [Acidobacteriota bacterium]